MRADPQVDADFFALAKMQNTQAYLEDVERWMLETLGESDEYVDVFEADDLEMDVILSGRRKPTWRRNR